MKILTRVANRVKTAVLTTPSQKSWLIAIGLLALYAVIYLPIGFALGFLTIEILPAWQVIIRVVVSAFLMPGVSEELGFRVLFIPLPSERVSQTSRYIWLGISWLLFLLWHLHPFSPAFFHTPAFLIGAGLLGIMCTISYLQSASLWTPAMMHGVIVAVWLVMLGGLGQFERSESFSG
jgi:uncharacterized protein